MCAGEGEGTADSRGAAMTFKAKVTWPYFQVIVSKVSFGLHSILCLNASCVKTNRALKLTCCFRYTGCVDVVLYEDHEKAAGFYKKNVYVVAC